MTRDDDEDDGRVFRDEDFTPDSTAHSPAEARQPSQIRTIVIAVVVTVAVLALGLFGWHKYSSDQAAKQARDYSYRVGIEMQDYLASDPNLGRYQLHVIDVDLNKVSDSKYEGVATVTTGSSSTEHFVPITVNIYGDRVMWQTEQGAFLFVVQDVLQPGG